MWNQATLLNTTVGAYRLVDFLGAGGMGEVYRAIHQPDGQIVAVKVLATPDPGLLARFRNEAEVHAQLRHPHIVELHDVLEVRGRPALVMEYVEGPTLEERLQREGPFSVTEALAIFRTVVGAVGAIHRHGVVHRDIKTANIKLTRTGTVKLLDFGIAKRPDAPGLTRTGVIVGTPQCLAPEQVRGQTVSAATDIWALGVLLYELVTDRPPFEADDPMALYRMIDQVDYVPPSVINPSVTPPIDAIVGRCLRRNPAQRCPSASALSDALAHSPSADLPVPSATPRRWMERIRWPRLRPPRAAANARADSPAFSTTALLRALRERLRIRPAFAVGILSLGLLLWLIATLPGSDAPIGADTHEMTIRVTGPPATVYVDGRRRGTTPYRLRARIGAPIELELRRDGYQSKTLHFTMPATRSTFQETLSPLP